MTKQSQVKRLFFKLGSFSFKAEFIFCIFARRLKNSHNVLRFYHKFTLFHSFLKSIFKAVAFKSLASLCGVDKIPKKAKPACVARASIAFCQSVGAVFVWRTLEKTGERVFKSRAGFIVLGLCGVKVCGGFDERVFKRGSYQKTR